MAEVTARSVSEKARDSGVFEVVGGAGGRVAEEATGQEEAFVLSQSSWLRSLGFFQSREDRAVWLIEKPEWHAQLSLDVTDLYVRYLKTGPGNLEKDMERRFSYALSREDIENAVLGGP
ncbi:uncharacterized protein LOC112172455 [Rosa chinensis]|uniref:uncharacterized protein LOC112172455 n=1 Tax=Rosa chinensis TaxID=74649 RepID=UPI000D08C217|nr:uncharacterized protein LOC112172455 [Rosa chinensis]